MHGLARNSAELKTHAPDLYVGFGSAMGAALQTLSEKPDNYPAILTEATVTTFRRRRFDDSHRQRWYWDSRSATSNVTRTPSHILAAWQRRSFHDLPRKTDITLDMPTDNGRVQVRYQGAHPDGASDEFVAAWYRPDREVLALDTIRSKELGFAVVVCADYAGIGMMLPSQRGMVHAFGPHLEKSLDVIPSDVPFAQGNGDRQILARYGFEGLADQYANFTLQALAGIAAGNGQNS